MKVGPDVYKGQDRHNKAHFRSVYSLMNVTRHITAFKYNLSLLVKTGCQIFFSQETGPLQSKESSMWHHAVRDPAAVEAAG